MDSLHPKTRKIAFVVILIAIFMLFTIIFFVQLDNIIGYNLDRVHPDEVEIRDWLREKGAKWSRSTDSKRHITSVVLDGHNVTKEDLKRLSKLTELRTLCLNDTNITDEFIPYINELKSLTRLEISGTKITLEGVYKLKVFGLQPGPNVLSNTENLEKEFGNEM